MVTALAVVTVTRVEAGNGFLIKCSNCDLMAVRLSRPAADAVAVEHRPSHVRPEWAS